MAVACMALFVALGGTSYAVTKINGDQIIKRSIDGSKLELNTVTAREIREFGMKTSFAGVADTAISAGSLNGVPAAAHVRNAEVIQADSALNSASPKSITPVCPAGKLVIGGGAEILGPEPVAVRKTAPNADRTGWLAEGFEANGTPDNWQLRAYAVCAER